VSRKQRAALEAARHAQTARMQAAAFRAANHADNVLTGAEAATSADGTHADVWGWSR
jgi:hypothetical protein